jgi:uncharacterized membrane protein YoaK (UPF0700 family)
VIPAGQLLPGLALTATSGVIDAVSFLVLGGYYTAFISGNTTQLGVALSHPLTGALLPLALVTLFFAGSFAGAFLRGVGERWGPLLTIGFVEAVMAVGLALFALGFGGVPAVVILAAAMGAQNAVIPRMEGARPGATFVTGSLFEAGQALANALRGRAPAWQWLQQLLIWGCLLLGAAIGGYAYVLAGWRALALPFVIYLGIAGVMAISGWRASGE